MLTTHTHTLTVMCVHSVRATPLSTCPIVYTHTHARTQKERDREPNSTPANSIYKAQQRATVDVGKLDKSDCSLSLFCGKKKTTNELQQIANIQVSKF